MGQWRTGQPNGLVEPILPVIGIRPWLLLGTGFIVAAALSQRGISKFGAGESFTYRVQATTPLEGSAQEKVPLTIKSLPAILPTFVYGKDLSCQKAVFCKEN